MKSAVTAAVLLFMSIVPTAAQTSRDTVKIGILTDMSGGLSDVSGPGSVEAAHMAVEDFGSTVLGKPIEILVGDHQNKPDIGLTIARQWYDVDNVDAIMDVLGTSVALGVQTLTRQRNKVLLITAALSDTLTNEACSPNGIAWIQDTYSIAHDGPQAIVKDGGDTWFFLTADYTFGYQLERTATDAIVNGGGKVLGGVRIPLLTPDMSSYLLTAQASGAKVIGLASGTDAVTVLKQAASFGIGPALNGQRFALLYSSIDDTHSVGLQTLQGANVIDSFYWDQTDETRAWSKRFFARRKVMPSAIQASNYSALMHYLQAVKAAGTNEPGPVLKMMRAMAINDFGIKGGSIRADGRLMRNMYLYRIKTLKESTGKWDLYNLVQTIPAEEAFRPLSESTCPLVK